MFTRCRTQLAGGCRAATFWNCWLMAVVGEARDTTFTLIS
jgi:hypothetical protein